MEPKEERNEALKMHQLVLTEYSAARKNLTNREQYFFDKAITLLEEIAEEESPSERTIVLSASVMAGVNSTKMSHHEYLMLAEGLGAAVLRAKVFGGQRGRSNSN